MIQVSLTKEEMDFCRLLGKARYDSNRKVAVKDSRQDSSRSEEAIDVDGVIGEFAFGKYFNLFMNLSIKPRSGSVDFVTHSGKRIDVKTCRGYGFLNVAYKARLRTDIDLYVNCQIKESLVEILGWVTFGEVIKEEFIFQGKLGPYYRYENSRLHKLFPDVGKRITESLYS